MQETGAVMAEATGAALHAGVHEAAAHVVGLAHPAIRTAGRRAGLREGSQRQGDGQADAGGNAFEVLLHLA
jgi:hypothetical protein